MSHHRSLTLYCVLILFRVQSLYNAAKFFSARMCEEDLLGILLANDILIMEEKIEKTEKICVSALELSDTLCFFFFFRA